jgi:hypothetical protein
MVNVKLPRTPLAVWTVKVDDVPVVLFGVNEAVAPAGRPVTPSDTDPEKPLVRPIASV